MSLIKPIQRSITNPTATAIEGASHSFARRGAESAATRRLGAGSRRSAVGDAAALGATVAMAALVYYIVHKVRQQERALPPVGRLTVDDARGPGGHQIGTGISATNSNPNWVFAIAAEATEYSRQSFDNSYAFFEKLTRAQELDDVIEIQSEFATKTFSNFMTRASKVFELCSNMTREAFASYLNGANAKVATVVTAKPLSEAGRQSEQDCRRPHRPTR